MQTHPLTEAEVFKQISKGKVNSRQQYQMIIANLKQQGLRLSQDRQQLRIRVGLLLQKQEQLLQQHRNNKKNPKVNYSNLKQQLQKKYKQFQNWRRKCYNSINKGAFNLQIKDYMNKCAIVEQEILKFRAMLADEKRSHRKVNKSIKVQLKNLNRNIPQRETLQEQNKQLRRMISNLRVIDDLTDHVDVRVHSSIVGLKHKTKIIQKLKTMTIDQIKRAQAKDKMQLISFAIKDKHNRQSSMRRMKTESKVESRYSFDLQKTEGEITIKEKTVTQKQLQSKKNQTHLAGLENQKHKLLQEQLRIAQILQEQQRTISKRLSLAEIQKIDISLQVSQYEDQNPLAIETIGNETLLVQDDRAVLKACKDTFITGLIAYENNIGVVCVRALYSNGKQTACLVPQSYLSKCKLKKIILADPKDYLKWLKVYYDTYQKKIVRMQVFSANKLKFQIGKEKDMIFKNVIPYKFDINSEDIPVCLKVTYRIEDTNWIMASMAVEINSR